MFAVGKRQVYGGLSALAAGVSAAVAIAACGHQATDHSHQLSIVEMDYRLRPAHITVPAGTLTLTVSNDGRQTHNFEVVSPTSTTAALTTTNGVKSYTTTVVARTPDLPPGASATITVPLAPIRYGIASTLQDDQGEGMQGSVTVASK